MLIFKRSLFCLFCFFLRKALHFTFTLFLFTLDTLCLTTLTLIFSLTRSHSFIMLSLSLFVSSINCLCNSNCCSNSFIKTHIHLLTMPGILNYHIVIIKFKYPKGYPSQAQHIELKLYPTPHKRNKKGKLLKYEET